MLQVCKVLLTGASGTIGRELLGRIVDQPDLEIHVFDKKNLENQLFYRRFQEKIRVYYGDLLQETSVAALPGGYDVVIHLAALQPPKADRKPSLIHEVNVNGTKLLIHHLETSSPNAFLYIVHVFRYMATGWRIR